jgi:hypothetical protein
VVNLLYPKPDTICAANVTKPPLGMLMQMANTTRGHVFQSVRVSRA